MKKCLNKTFLRHYDVVILVQTQAVCFGGQPRMDWTQCSCSTMQMEPLYYRCNQQWHIYNSWNPLTPRKTQWHFTLRKLASFYNMPTSLSILKPQMTFVERELSKYCRKALLFKAQWHRLNSQGMPAPQLNHGNKIKRQQDQRTLCSPGKLGLVPQTTLFQVVAFLTSYYFLLCHNFCFGQWDLNLFTINLK